MIKRTKMLGEGHIDVTCPWREKVTLCGNWCPLFVEKRAEYTNYATNIKGEQFWAEILCGCRPVTYEIVEDERK